jgi:cell division protein FtsL
LNKVVNTYSLNNRLAATRRPTLADPRSAALSASPATAARKTPVYLPGRAEMRERLARRAARRQQNFLPTWLIFIFVVAFTFIMCVIVNVQTRSELQMEMLEQQQLHTEIEQLQNDNSALANEIHRLQSDPATIERAARERLNMARPTERISLVPVR